MAAEQTPPSAVDRVARPLAAAADFVRALTGWRRFVVALVAGLLSALAFAPYDIFPLLLVGYAVLVVMLDGASQGPHRVRNAFGFGWAFGFGQFLAGLYWVAYAFMVDPSAHEWQIPFVLTLFPGGLALFPALACAASAWLWRKGPARVFVFTVLFAIACYLRGHILTGFPWNLPAYGWGASLGVLQSASVVGAYGLSLLTILFGASLALLGEPPRKAWALPVAMTAGFALIWLAGLVRLGEAPTRFVPDVRLRLVQPDVPQDQKFLPQDRARNWQTLIDLSRENNGPPPTDIIWPEAAPPFMLLRVPAALGDVARLTEGNTVLMTGSVRAVTVPAAPPRFYNSFLIFAHGGELLHIYDKFHLVPFGEYLPLAPLMKWLGLSKLVESPGGFSAGDGPHTFDVPGAPPVGPLICYEVIFPGAVIGARRPGWIVNVTDDSWFGPPSSSGPHQHLLIARVRAIEEGLPIARAANTGVSAIIDPLGRILSELGVGRMGVVDGQLPLALSPTIYARFGDAGFFILLFVCAVVVYIGIRQRH